MVSPNRMEHFGKMLIVCLSLFLSNCRCLQRKGTRWPSKECISHVGLMYGNPLMLRSRMTDSIDCLMTLDKGSWGKTWLECVQLSDTVCLLSLLACSNRFHCMTYWLETSKVEVTSFGEQLFNELEWMKSLVSASIKFCSSLLPVMP